MNASSVFKLVEHELAQSVAAEFRPLLQVNEEIWRRGLGLHVLENPRNVRNILVRRLKNAKRAGFDDLADWEQEIEFLSGVMEGAIVWRLHYYFGGKRWEISIDSSNGRYLKLAGEIPVGSERTDY